MIITKFSKRGQYHKSINAENQDIVYSFENADICYISIADGASSCKNGRQGAEIACKCVKKLLLDCNIFSFDKEKIAYVIWEEIMFHIKTEAIKQNTAVENFSCTYAFACFDKRTNALLTYNLGNGAVFVKYDKENEYMLLSAPKVYKGNCTLVSNVNAYRDADITHNKFFKGSVLLCTDGFCNILMSGRVDINDIIKEPDSVNVADDVSFILMQNRDEVS